MKTVSRLRHWFPVLLIPVTATPQQPASCSSAPHRQFDFWIGEWDVSDRRGTRLGVNRIERMPNDCAIYETWSGIRGDQAQSVSAFDPATNQWHQTWVDNAGTMLRLSGGIVNGEMVLEGERTLPDGSEVLDRVTWTPNADGTVRQVWLSSRERGMRWTAVFEGMYRRIR